MDDLKGFSQFRKDLADGSVDGYRSQTASDDQEDRFSGCKTAEIQGSQLIAVHEFLTDGGSGEDSFSFRKIFYCLREITADLCGSRKRQLVCQPRSHIGFMDNRRNMAFFCCLHHRYSDKSAFGKYHIRLQFFQNFFCFGKALDHTEGIGEVLPVKITAQFSGGDTVIGDPHLLNQFFFNPVIGTDIIYFIV